MAHQRIVVESLRYADPAGFAGRVEAFGLLDRNGFMKQALRNLVDVGDEASFQLIEAAERD